MLQHPPQPPHFIAEHFTHDARVRPPSRHSRTRSNSSGISIGMDLIDELESMVASAPHVALDDIEDVVTRWKNLFNYSQDHAEKQVQAQRSDVTALVPQALWEMVREQQEVLGHDRESYSHWLSLSRSVAPVSQAQPACGMRPQITDTSGREHLFRLEGPIDTVEKLQQVAALRETPHILPGTSDEDDDIETAEFCRVDAQTKVKITAWKDVHAPLFRPLFVVQSLAVKDLSEASYAPTLGVDSTMPQNRPDSVEAPPRPLQSQYPVWYFFYGTLGSEHTLHRLFSTIDPRGTKYELHEATVAGGRMSMWQDKYRALVDDRALYPAEPIEGFAFLVQSKKHEDVLRSYETAAYEVARCWIRFSGQHGNGVQGLTFRFRHRPA